jgi:hypothetical protein
MTIRSQAFLFMLVMATAATNPAARHGLAPGHPAEAQRPDQAPSYTIPGLQAPQGVALPDAAGLPTGRAVVVYSVEPELFRQPIASPRAPFVNVYALYHRQPCDGWTCLQQPLSADLEDLFELSLASSAGASAQESLAPGSQAHEPMGSHFLLTGQQTALLAPGAPAARDARA